MRFGDILKLLREEREWTQKELGQKINVSDRVIGYWESNDRFPKDESVIKLIANLFNVSTDYLLGRIDERNPTGSTDDEWPPEAKVMFRDMKKLTPEQKELVLKLVKEFIGES